MLYKHDSPTNELTAARAHYAMKWGYRAQTVLMLATIGFIAAAPKKDALGNILSTMAIGLCVLNIAIGSEAAQWHQRAAEEHSLRAKECIE